MGQWEIALRELGRSDSVVAEFLQNFDSFLDGLEVDPVLKGEDRPGICLRGKLSDEEQKREEGNDLSHGRIGIQAMTSLTT